MACEKQYRYDPQYNNLPVDQGGAGRHRCAGCAYESGELFTSGSFTSLNDINATLKYNNVTYTLKGRN